MEFIFVYCFLELLSFIGKQKLGNSRSALKTSWVFILRENVCVLCKKPYIHNGPQRKTQGNVTPLFAERKTYTE